MIGTGLGLLLSPGLCLAQTPSFDLDPLGGANEIVAWFVKLNADFDQIVVLQERKQLARALDRLRVRLYDLETGTRDLRDAIPPGLPPEAVLKQLDGLVVDLFTDLQALQGAVRALGADLRRTDEAQGVENRLGTGLDTRRRVLTAMAQSLGQARQGVWKPAQMTATLNAGIDAVYQAQIAVIGFLRRLDKSVT